MEAPPSHYPPEHFRHRSRTLRARIIMHLAGTRIDEAAVKLAEHMILYRQPAKFLMLQTTGLALRISGYKGSMFGYPGQRPSSTVTMMSHRSHFLDCSISEAFSELKILSNSLSSLGPAGIHAVMICQKILT